MSVIHEGETTSGMLGDSVSSGLAATNDAGFILVCGPQMEQLPVVWPLRAPTTLIGRERAPDVFVIAQSSVSRSHARVDLVDGQFFLRDLGSRNGVFVNGRRLADPVALEPNDIVRIGDALYRFVRHDVSPYAGYSPIEIARSGHEVLPGMVGGKQLADLAREVRTIAPTTLSVFVHGETGTGKELVAAAIHDLSTRRGRLVAVNCAAIPANLLESELFGYKRGAFTGAVKDHDGLIRSAEGGTLFLDEIGDLPPEAQAKLLRVLETREVTALGSTAPYRVDVRVVSATHRDLASAATQGGFRADLYARLNGATLRIPALRDRKEDLVPLVHHLLRRHNAANREVGIAIWAALAHYDWPFNVRELDGAIRRALSMSTTSELRVTDLPEVVRSVPAALPTRPPVLGEVDAPNPNPNLPASHDDADDPQRPVRVWRRRPTTDELRQLLASHNGNISAVARAIGRDRAQVHRWLKELGIQLDDFRK